ncbi:MAG: hypothetical protein N3E51_00645 [Candidatus Micrarchaeota archaeon]|nr:hypothetical protein [Candidatus Micrarchaeota archaeon]
MFLFQVKLTDFSDKLLPQFEQLFKDMFKGGKKPTADEIREFFKRVGELYKQMIKEDEESRKSSGAHHKDFYAVSAFCYNAYSWLKDNAPHMDFLSESDRSEIAYQSGKMMEDIKPTAPQKIKELGFDSAAFEEKSKKFQFFHEEGYSLAPKTEQVVPVTGYSYKDLEEQFLQIHMNLKHYDQATLRSFYERVLGLYSSINRQSLSDVENAKQIAFCINALEWLAEAFGTAGLKGLAAEATNKSNELKNLSSSVLEKEKRHYAHYFAAVSHLVVQLQSGKQAFLFNQRGVELLVKMLDDASEKNRTTVAIAFPSTELADIFRTQVLPHLPFAKISDVKVKNGDEYTSFNLAGKTVVSFSCDYDPANQPKPYVQVPAEKEEISQEEEIDIKKTKKEQTERLPPGITEEEKKNLLQNVQQTPVLESSRRGESNIEEVAGLYYALRYQGRNPESKEVVRSTVIKVLELLAAHYGYQAGKDYQHIEDFVKTEDGKNFLRNVRDKITRIIGSASVEVFYTGNNYKAYRNALVSNWNDAAGQRAEMALDAFNELLISAGLEAVHAETTMRLHVYQDIDENLKNRLLNDSYVPEDMKNWLRNTYKYGDGQKNLTDLMNYLKEHDKSGTTYQKLLSCCSVSTDENGNEVYTLTNPAQMNVYFSRMPSDTTLRGKGNKNGLRNESDPDNMLVNAIEEGFTTQGSSRSVAFNVSFSGELGIRQENITSKTYKPGETISVKIEAPYKIEGENVDFMRGMNENGVSDYGKVVVEIYDETGKKLDCPVKIVKKQDGYYAEFTPRQEDLKVETSEKKLEPKKTKSKDGETQVTKETEYTKKTHGNFSIVAYAISEDGKLNSGMTGQTLKVEHTEKISKKEYEKIKEEKKRSVEEPYPVTYPINTKFQFFTTGFDFSSNTSILYGQKYLSEFRNAIIEANNLFQKGKIDEGLQILKSRLYNEANPNDPNTLFGKLKALIENPPTPGEQKLAQNWLLAFGKDMNKMEEFFKNLVAGNFASAYRLMADGTELKRNTNLVTTELSLTGFDAILGFLQYSVNTYQAKLNINISKEKILGMRGMINLYVTYEHSTGTFTFRDFPLSEHERQAGNITVMAVVFPAEQLAAFVTGGISAGRYKTVSLGKTDIAWMHGFNTSIGIQYDFLSGLLKGLRTKIETLYEHYFIKNEKGEWVDTWALTPSMRITAQDYLGGWFKPYWEGSFKVTEKNWKERFYVGTGEIGAMLRPFYNTDLAVLKHINIDLAGSITTVRNQPPHYGLRASLIIPILSGEDEINARQSYMTKTKG